MKTTIRVILGLIVCTALVAGAAYLGGGFENPAPKPKIQTAIPVPQKSVQVYQPPAKSAPADSAEKESMKNLKLR